MKGLLVTECPVNHYINDILNEIENIIEFTQNLVVEGFEKDIKTQYAVVRSFEIIGEAVKNLSADIRDKYPEIPWKRMAGMRDNLIHEYFGVNMIILWETVRKRISELKKQLGKFTMRYDYCFISTFSISIISYSLF